MSEYIRPRSAEQATGQDIVTYLIDEWREYKQYIIKRYQGSPEMERRAAEEMDSFFAFMEWLVRRRNEPQNQNLHA